MSVERTSLVPAFVVHTRPFRDSSLIVELFTPTHGRVSAVARGVKRGKAQKGRLLQPFRALHVSWAGRTDLPALSAVEEAHAGVALRGKSLACGYYVNELVYHLVPRGERAETLFAHYWPTLESMTDPAQIDVALRTFETTLLQHLGYAPVTDRCTATNALIKSDADYLYHIPDGPRLLDHSLPAGNKAASVKISGAALRSVGSCDFADAEHLREVKQLLRRLLHYHLDGRELESRKLFRAFSVGQSANPAGRIANSGNIAE